MLEKLNTIVDHLKNDNQEWFVTQNIVVKKKGDFWILNYPQTCPVKNDYNRLTRGLVIHKDRGVVSCPFFRFFNYGEKEAASVDFTNADLIEKLDGSFLAVTFDDKMNPMWNFRSLLSSHQEDMDFMIDSFILNEESPLLKEAGKFVKEVNFPVEFKDYTLIFEFISRVNKVVTNYKPAEYGIYLIGARHVPTLYEMSENELDELSKVLNIRRPRRWETKTFEETLGMLKDFPSDYEGFVVRDRVTGERIKVKNPEYLKRHKLLNRLSYKRLIPLWMEGERSEIETYIAETKEIFDRIANCYENSVKEAIESVRHWRSKVTTKKDLALTFTTKCFLRSVALSFFSYEGDLEEAIRNHVKKMSAGSLIELWKLKEEAEEEVLI